MGEKMRDKYFCEPTEEQFIRAFDLAWYLPLIFYKGKLGWELFKKTPCMINRFKRIVTVKKDIFILLEDVLDFITLKVC